MSEKTTNMIQRVELACYDSPLHCPFCGSLAYRPNSNEPVPASPCEHLLFCAHDEGFEFRSARFDKIMGIEGIPNEDVEIEEGYDNYTDGVACRDAVKFATYVPAPSGMGCYYGFTSINNNE